MARLQGTGKDPLGRYGEDVIFDVPRDDPDYHHLVEELGWATALDPADDPARTEHQMANAIVRGDNLTNPDDRAAAEAVDDPYAKVHDVEKSADVLGGKGAGNPLTDPPRSSVVEEASGTTGNADDVPPKEGGRPKATREAEEDAAEHSGQPR